MATTLVKMSLLFLKKCYLCIFICILFTAVAGRFYALWLSKQVNVNFNKKPFSAFHYEMQDPNFKLDYECGKIIEVLKFI
jgi:hypothetical protein